MVMLHHFGKARQSQRLSEAELNRKKPELRQPWEQDADGFGWSKRVLRGIGKRVASLGLKVRPRRKARHRRHPEADPSQ